MPFYLAKYSNNILGGACTFIQHCEIPGIPKRRRGCGECYSQPNSWLPDSNGRPCKQPAD